MGYFPPSLVMMKAFILLSENNLIGSPLFRKGVLTETVDSSASHFCVYRPLQRPAMMSKSLISLHAHPRSMPIRRRPSHPLSVHQRRLLIRTQTVRHRMPLFHILHPPYRNHRQLRSFTPASSQEAEGIAYDDDGATTRGTNGDVSRFGFGDLAIGWTKEMERGWRVEEDEEGPGVGVGFHIAC